MELSCKYVSNGLHPYLWQPVIAHWDANKLIINSIQLLDQLGSLVIGSWVTADVSDDRVWLENPPLTLSILISKEDPGVDQQLPTTYIRVRRGCTLDNVTQNNTIKMTCHKLWMDRELWLWALNSSDQSFKKDFVNFNVAWY